MLPFLYSLFLLGAPTRVYPMSLQDCSFTEQSFPEEVGTVSQPDRHEHHFGSWEPGEHHRFIHHRTSSVGCIRKCKVPGCDETQREYHNWGSWSRFSDTECQQECHRCHQILRMEHDWRDWHVVGETSHQITLERSCRRCPHKARDHKDKD